MKLLMKIPLLLLILACPFVHGDEGPALSQHQWAGAPTILKTSKVFGTGGKSCGKEFETCIGPARAASAPNQQVRMVKCFIPRNNFTCPTLITTQNGCSFAEVESTNGPAIPACHPSGSFDSFPGGCHCGAYGDPRKRATSRVCGNEMYTRVAAQVRLKCNGTAAKVPADASYCSSTCSEYSRFRANAGVLSACNSGVAAAPSAPPVVPVLPVAPVITEVPRPDPDASPVGNSSYHNSDPADAGVDPIAGVYP